MRMLLLSPGKLSFYGSEAYPAFYPRLGNRILAATAPEGWSVDIREHEDVETLTYEEDVDLVGLSVLTPHAPYCYAIADRYRSRGVKVILGGMHPTIRPAEAGKHADAVVVGEAELVWPALLRDAAAETLRPEYRADRLVSGREIPLPTRPERDGQLYGRIWHLEAGRGCGVGCGFCMVPAVAGRCHRPRPVEALRQELDSVRRSGIRAPHLVFSDNILGCPEHARAAAGELSRHPVTWSAEGDIWHLDDAAYLTMLRESGLSEIYVEMKACSKRQHGPIFDKCRSAMEKIHQRGIGLYMNLTVGYDDHDRSVFDSTIELAKAWPETEMVLQILVPWPGTPLFDHWSRQKRLRTYDWSRYNNLEFVFEPARMSAVEMAEAHLAACRELQRLRSKARAAAAGGTSSAERDAPSGVGTVPLSAGRGQSGNAPGCECLR